MAPQPHQRPAEALRKSAALRLALLAGALSVVGAGGPSPAAKYPIPDPFKRDAGSAAQLFYYIKSNQALVRAHEPDQPQDFEVSDFFSLRTGLSYSLHRARNDPSQAYALIADGPRSRSYIVRNPDVEDAAQLDCELDHVHHHKQAFPWQYVFDGPHEPAGSSEAQRRFNEEWPELSRQRKWARKRFIYGVGAILLNAIARNVQSDQVGDLSPLTGANLWQMNERGLEVKLIFKKPAERTAQALADSPLYSIQIVRRDSLQTRNGGDKSAGSQLVQEEQERIAVLAFERRQPPDSDLARLQRQLEACRNNNKRHRSFPSLVRAMSLAPARGYILQYAETRFGALRPDSEGAWNGRLGRRDWTQSFTSEVFSYQFEALARSHTGLRGPNRADNYQHTYLSLFSERETARSSRHATGHLYWVSKDGDTLNCTRGLREPPPADHLMGRPLTLTRANGRKLSGRTQGLGALLQNMADVHYKEFKLARVTIEASFDPKAPQLRQPVRADEWRVEDERSGHLYQFFFRAVDAAQQQASDLLRVDVRRLGAARDADEDAGASGPADESGELEPASEGPRLGQLVLRFDIGRFSLDASTSEMAYHLRAPPICAPPSGPEQPEQPRDDDKNNDNNDDQPDPAQDDYAQPFGPNEVGAPDSDRDEAVYDEEQREGERFELEPGFLREDERGLPDYFEFFAGQLAYQIVSRIDLHPAAGLPAGATPRHLYLREMVDLVAGHAHLSIFSSRAALARGSSEHDFYVDYGAEQVLRVWPDGSCRLDSDVEPWMRLLSARIDYYRQPNLLPSLEDERAATDERDKHDVAPQLAVASDRLRLYGVGSLWRRASETSEADFEGASEPYELEQRSGAKSKHRELVWSLMDDHEDEELSIRLHFQLNETAYLAEGGSTRLIDAVQLDSIDIVPIPEPTETDTAFASINITVMLLERVEPRSWQLPNACIDTIVQAHRLENEVYAKRELASRMPGPLDYLASSSSYLMHYTVTQAQDESVMAMPVSEWVDRTTNRAHIVTGSGPNTREIFVDGASRSIYLYASETGQCKRAATVSTLVDLGPSFKGANPNFEPDKLYGLGALWQRLATELSDLSVKRTWRYEGHQRRGLGASLPVYTYTKAADWSGEPVVPRSRPFGHSIRAIFVGRLEEIASSHDGLETAEFAGQQMAEWRHLEQLDIIPLEASTTSGRGQRKTRIEVTALNRDPSSRWDLPDACASLAAGPADRDVQSETERSKEPAQTTDSPQKVLEPDVAFPRLTELIRATQQFFMRSEITSRALEFETADKPDEPVKANTRSLFMLDEWLYNGNLRIKSGNLGRKNIDILIYPFTGELFDLSTPFRCPKVLPATSLTSSDPEITKSLVDFWAPNSTSVLRTLTSAYFGPVALWHLAERLIETRQGSVSLANKVDLLPGAISKSSGRVSGQSGADALARELRTETWLVQGPENRKQPGSKRWSFEMTFERVQQTLPDGRQREWHVLERIDAKHEEFLGIKRSVEIEVTNYRYNHTDSDIVQQFLLPEGHGCQRDLSSTLSSWNSLQDALELSTKRAQAFSYEASMELIRSSDGDSESGPGDQSRYLAPTLTGAYFRSSPELVLDNFQINVQYNRLRFVNGSVHSTRRVFDGARSLHYVMDTLSGSCQIARGSSQEFKLAFPIELGGSSQTQLVSLTPELIQLLLLDSSGKQFAPLNRYRQDSKWVASYESVLDSIQLSGTLVSPAIVTRRFEWPSHSDPKQVRHEDGSVTRLHSRVLVKIWLLDEARVKPEAILTLLVTFAREPTALELVRRSNVAQCFDDGSSSRIPRRAFSIEYEPVRDLGGMVNYKRQAIENQFLEKLLSFLDLLPSQLDGPPRMSTFANGQGISMRFAFELMEPPSAYRYFTERVESTMSVELLGLADFKISPSLEECSSWCDTSGCLAFSYCASRTCHILTKNMLLAGSDADNSTRRTSLTAKDLLKLELTAPDHDCSYYFSTSPPPKTIDQFKTKMEAIFGRLKQYAGALTSLSLRVLAQDATPTQFEEIQKAFDWSLEDRGSSEDDTQDTSPRVYKLLKRNHRLDFANLKEDGDGIDVDGGKFEVKLEHAKSYSNCIQRCVSHECKLFSYCRHDGACVLVSDVSNDLKQLEATHEPNQEGCSISVRDFLLGYQKFGNTSPPSKAMRELVGYSPLECAAICDSLTGAQSDGNQSDFNCLSFDSCTVKPIESDSNKTPQSFCLLQNAHVMLDDFDRTILSPKSHELQTEASRQRFQGLDAVCDHYSRSILADFKKISNRRLPRHFNSIMRGSNPERCALGCRQDDGCLAFEHCFDDKSSPTQSCYHIRGEDLKQYLKDNRTETVDQQKAFLNSLKLSKKCSIHLLIHSVEEYQLDEKNHLITIADHFIQLIERHGNKLPNIFILIGKVLIALASGLLIRFILYIFA